MQEYVKTDINDLIDHLEQQISDEYEILLDICCNMVSEKFVIDYRLRNVGSSEVKTIRLEINQDEVVPSVAKLFKNAELMECELFEMFGVSFAMHPNLRKILTDDLIEGNPLRKEFGIETETKHHDIG